MAMWFTTGMRPSDTPWFFPSDPKPWTFEERFAERFKPLLPSIGSPELVVLSSHFWDLKFFQDRELRRRLLAEEPDAPFHITEEDLAWHRSRLVEFVALVRSTFPDALVMWRLGTKWKVDEEAGFGDGNLGVFRLNESTRAMMRMLEVPLFNWAALIEGERGYSESRLLCVPYMSLLSDQASPRLRGWSTLPRRRSWVPPHDHGHALPRKSSHSTATVLTTYNLWYSILSFPTISVGHLVVGVLPRCVARVVRSESLRRQWDRGVGASSFLDRFVFLIASSRRLDVEEHLQVEHEIGCRDEELGDRAECVCEGEESVVRISLLNPV